MKHHEALLKMHNNSLTWCRFASTISDYTRLLSVSTVSISADKIQPSKHLKQDAPCHHDVLLYVLGQAFGVQLYPTKVYNEQVNDEPGNYGAGFLGLRHVGWSWRASAYG